MSFQNGGPFSVSKHAKEEDNSTFEQLLHSKTVIWESCQLECEDEKSHAVKGVIAAAVIEKAQVTNVFVRHTKDCWESYDDITAEFVSSELAGDGANFDRFEFKLPFNIDTTVVAGDNDHEGDEISDWSCSMEFAIAYQVNTYASSEFWDNNEESNYQINLRSFRTLQGV